MEQNQALFSLSIDPVTKSYLNEISKWAKFLAILGMIMMAVMVIGGVALAVGMSAAMTDIDPEMGGTTGAFGSFGAGAAGAFYIILAVLMFFPLLYLLRFSNRMRAALHGNDQNSLNVGFQNLKAYFKFIGILTIIILALWIVGIVFAVMTMGAL